MSPLMFSLFVFVLVAIVGVCITAAIGHRSNVLGDRFVDMSVKMRVIYGAVDSQGIGSEGMVRDLFRWALKKVPEPKLDKPEVAKVARIMIQAGYPGSHAMHVFELIRIASAVAGTCEGFALSLVLGWSGIAPVMAMIFGTGLGAWLPLFLIMRKARRRRAEITSQLANVLDLLVVCVEAGLGVTEAIKVVGSELERQGQLIGRELAAVAAEVNAGTPLGQAMRRMAERTNVEDIKPLAANMIQSEQLGAQMGPALRSIAEGVRNARRLRAEEAAQKTTVKILFPLIFFVLPAMMIVIVGPAMIEVMKAMSQGSQ